MKLRNLLFVSLLATTFVACSNEDDLGGKQPQEAKAQPASVFFKTDAVKSLERADGFSLKLGIYKDNRLVAQTTNTAADGTIDQATAPDDDLTAVEGGTNYQILVLANMNASLPANLASGSDCVLEAESFESNDQLLPMSSAITNVVLYPGINYLGYDVAVGSTVTNEVGGHGDGKSGLEKAISLVRNVAGVQLKGVKLDITKTAGRTYESVTSADFTLTGVYIKNAPTNWDFIAKVSTEWVNGFKSENGEVVSDAAYYNAEVTASKMNQSSKAAVPEGENSYTQVTAKQFYVIANNADIVLGLRGDFVINEASYKLTDGSETVYNIVPGNLTSKTYYYNIHLNNRAALAANTKYLINATIAGTGNGTPDDEDGEVIDGNIYYKTTIVGWNEDETQGGTVGQE